MKSSMTPIAYTGYRPTMQDRSNAWLWPKHNLAIIGVEVAPEAFGIVIFGVWIGVVRDE